jgi:hypothetical protein
VYVVLPRLVSAFVGGEGVVNQCNVCNVHRFLSKGVKGSEPTGPTLVGSFMFDKDGNFSKDKDGNAVVGGAEVYKQFVKQYGFEATSGDQAVFAWTDENNNQLFDKGDYLGVYPEPVTVKAGATTDKVDRGVGFILEVSSAINTLSSYKGLERFLKP